MLLLQPRLQPASLTTSLLLRAAARLNGGITRSFSGISESKTGTSSKPLTPRPDQERALQEVNQLILRASDAQRRFASFSQNEVDRIVEAAALAAVEARIPLAQLAHSETQRGVFEDKVIKNHFAAENVANYLRGKRTCRQHGADETFSNTHFGMTKVPEPYGVVVALTPSTNPTSSVIFKALMLLKSRNAALFCFHPGSFKCSALAADIMLKAAIEAGAPDGILSWFQGPPTREQVRAVMGHAGTAMVWATGGADMVRAAKATGKPSFLGGPGNCPALIDETANIPRAISDILLSKTFDNGMICGAEQSMVVVDSVYDDVIRELRHRGAMVLSPLEVDLLRKAMASESKPGEPGGHIAKALVGMSAQTIGQIAGFDVPPGVRALVAEAPRGSLDPQQEPLAWEKMSPILGLFRAADYSSAVDICKTLVDFSGRGHVGVIHTSHGEDSPRVQEYIKSVPVGFTLLNQPSSQGTIGDIFNFKMIPRLSVPTGSGFTDVPIELLQRTRTTAQRASHSRWLHLPPRIYFDPGCTMSALQDLASSAHRRNPSVWRVMLLSDHSLEANGFVRKVTDFLEDASGVRVIVESFLDIEPDPGFPTVLRGLEMMRGFQPDTIIALGGGSVMDAAKIMRLLLDHPEANNMAGLRLRFMDITKRVFSYPAATEHRVTAKGATSEAWARDIDLVCIPTTSGTGSEVSPFAVVTDPTDGVKYPLCSYTMTPRMAIVDSNFCRSMPASLVAAPGFDAIVHAVESYTSALSSDFTKPMSMRAIELLCTKQNLIKSFTVGDAASRDAVHSASTLSGCAIANAFVGIAHSIAHQLGAQFHIPHGIACAIALPPVIKFNSSNAPTKQVIFPQYGVPHAAEQYAAIARNIGLPFSTDAEAVDALTAYLVQLRKDLKLPGSLRECGVSKTDFDKAADTMALRAFDDQCTVTSPRYPLVAELRALIEQCY